MAHMGDVEAEHQARNSGSASHSGTCRRSTPRSRAASPADVIRDPPLPVTTSTMRALGLGAAQEAQQTRVRLGLRHAVQIDAGVDRLASARRRAA